MPSIFIISDLHLGGRPHDVPDGKPGFSICSHYERLSEFIDWISSGNAANDEVKLVLNGDIVDFLLDDDFEEGVKVLPWTPDPDDVILKLDQIIERTRENGQKSPFDALKRFCNPAQGRKHSLVLILGNHDVELSLPKVREYFLNDILNSTGINTVFIYDGEAYVYGELLIEHGNRYDRFNIIDHSGLRQERSVMSRGMSLEYRDTNDRYEPPVGSLLVTEIFNPLKKDFRFLDLLKPETEAVIPLLLVLEPKLDKAISALLKRINKIGPQLYSSAVENAEPERARQLTTPSVAEPLTLQQLLLQEFGEEALDDFSISRSTKQLSAGDTLNVAMEWISELIDTTGTILSRQRENVKKKLLRVVLRRLYNDISFVIHKEKDLYLDAVKQICSSGDFKTIIFGHSHLPKNVTFADSGSSGESLRYLNCGTWADIMLLPVSFIDRLEREDETLDIFLNDLRDNNLEKYLVSMCSYAEVITDERKSIISANIWSYSQGDPRKPISLEREIDL